MFFSRLQSSSWPPHDFKPDEVLTPQPTTNVDSGYYVSSRINRDYYGKKDYSGRKKSIQLPDISGIINPYARRSSLAFGNGAFNNPFQRTTSQPSYDTTKSTTETTFHITIPHAANVFPETRDPTDRITHSETGTSDILSSSSSSSSSSNTTHYCYELFRDFVNGQLWALHLVAQSGGSVYANGTATNNNGIVTTNNSPVTAYELKKFLHVYSNYSVWAGLVVVVQLASACWKLLFDERWRGLLPWPLTAVVLAVMLFGVLCSMRYVVMAVWGCVTERMREREREKEQERRAEEKRQGMQKCWNGTGFSF